MTSSELVQRRIRDSLMENERRIFMQLIQDELPNLTLRELGEILTGPAGRSVGDLPVKALLGLAVAPAPVAARPPRNVKPARPRSGARGAGRRAAGSPPSPEPAPAGESTPVPGDTPAPIASVAAPAPQPPPAANIPTIEPLPPGQSNVAIIQSIVSRALARHHRQDPDTQVLTALRGVGDWIRARDLRGRVELQPDELRASLNRLVKAGAVQRSGEGPDTVYLVVGGSAAAAPGT